MNSSLCIHDARNFDEYTQVLVGDATNKMAILGGEEGAAICIALLCTIGKNMIFWRKIVIFHTKYLKHFRASLRSAQFF